MMAIVGVILRVGVLVMGVAIDDHACVIVASLLPFLLYRIDELGWRESYARSSSFWLDYRRGADSATTGPVWVVQTSQSVHAECAAGE
jgi:hypothetical protein